MITEFKIFEELNEGKPKIGDYAICSSKTSKLYNFFETHIGKITGFEEHKFILYYDEPEFRNVKILFSEKYIKYWSKNKEDLDFYIQANKYNL